MRGTAVAELLAGDTEHLTRCVELAAEALRSGEAPFGSVLVDGSGRRRFEDYNRIRGGDDTQHPEFAIARWAAENMSPEERASATVFTSGEHCPMCSAAHAWVGLGDIVYASSSAQLAQWLEEFGVPLPPVATLPVNQVAPGVQVRGPSAQLSPQVRELQRRYHLQ